MLNTDNRLLLLAFTAFAAAVALWITGSDSKCPVENIQIPLQIGEERLLVEVAHTAESRHCGLSHRSELAAGQGMLFVFAQAGRWPFWMKDTHIPLSLAYLDADQRIIQIERLTPQMDEKRVMPKQLAQFVLEVPIGWFERHGVGVGDRAVFQLPASLSVEG